MNHKMRNIKSKRLRKSKKEKMNFIDKIKIKTITDPIDKALCFYNEEKNVRLKKQHQDHLFLVRIALNFIRHNHSNYDRLLTCFKGNDLVNLNQFKESVNEKILKKYNNFLQG